MWIVSVPQEEWGGIVQMEPDVVEEGEGGEADDGESFPGAIFCGGVDVEGLRDVPIAFGIHVE